jgi:hypothetical protein
MTSAPVNDITKWWEQSNILTPSGLSASRTAADFGNHRNPAQLSGSHTIYLLGAARRHNWVLQLPHPDHHDAMWTMAVTSHSVQLNSSASHDSTAGRGTATIDAQAMDRYNRAYQAACRGINDLNSKYQR